MPEMKFYITDDERMELFDFITSNDGIFISSVWHSKPEAIRIQSKEEFIKFIDEIKIGFYVISPRFQTEPLIFNRFGEKDEYCIMQGFRTEPLIFEQLVEKKGQSEGKYYIMHRRGGPYIDFGFYRGYADDAPIKYKCTDISHYPSYTRYDDFETYERFPVSNEFKAYYRMAVKFLKSKCRQITAKNGYKYWVSKTLKEEDVIYDIVSVPISHYFIQPSTPPVIGTFTDPRDGKTYRTAKIGEQVWMAENLAYEFGKSRCYNNDPENCKKYGRLYSWDDAMKAAPSGWHLPSMEEWDVLTDFIGGELKRGYALKAKSGWTEEWNGIDAYGFSALPGGTNYYNNDFCGVGEYGTWWTAAEYHKSHAYNFLIIKHKSHFNGTWKCRLHSVRCIKD
ncbi:MAG: fibrobacter succinogenes major paralogous domain-containing protein [Prevotellaceae bacterium]|jgi:uncharacterized protein (TIGR02145 family)|nr:fibrobacter succinogenes major paralogous domain-containing protein [Prevotellaceae bacterium]